MASIVSQGIKGYVKLFIVESHRVYLNTTDKFLQTETLSFLSMSISDIPGGQYSSQCSQQTGMSVCQMDTT